MASHLLHKQVSSMAFKSTFVPNNVKFSNAATACRVQRRAVKVFARQHEVDVGLFGTKAGMMSWFTTEGFCVPATVIALEPGNVVTQIKTEETDGYNAVQVGYQVVAERKITKPELGHLEKAGAPAVRHLREFKLKDKKRVEAFTPGQQLNVTDMFKEGDLLDIAGTSIGKGFQGTIKRYNFKRGNMTHGSKSKREHGSLGPGTTPGRVFPGVKMAGRMGGERVKIRKVEVLKVDAERGAVVVKGCVPGKPGNVLEITTAKAVGRNFKAGEHY